MTPNGITIEELEALASQIESEENAERNRLMRLTQAYTRILAVREPDKFTRRALEYSDEEGHYDNSYPPKQEYKDFSGPRAIRIVPMERDEVSTSGGFYYSYRIVTKDPGLYVTAHGEFIGASATGTGSFGAFAAHPGHCDVSVALDWDTLDSEDLTIERLRLAEQESGQTIIIHGRRELRAYREEAARSEAEHLDNVHYVRLSSLPRGTHAEACDAGLCYGPCSLTR